MTTTEPTTTVSTAELDALRAIARAANVIAAGDHVDRHEREQALDALPHLCDALAAETSDAAAAAAHSAARDRRFVERARARRVAAFAPRHAVAGAVRTEDWLTRMGALGALSPDHQAAYEALAQAGVQPYQLRFLATAVSCGLIAPAERGTRP
ncbi:hypothetical protein SAMN04487781_3205 [Cellulosimicrobium cellulans]|nr:hypothetical protein SAMN04487781_3205 [Cellulosimicrobium cellulans]